MSVKDAVSSAREAFKDWKDMSIENRIELMKKFSGVLFLPDGVPFPDPGVSEEEVVEEVG